MFDSDFKFIKKKTCLYGNNEFMINSIFEIQLIFFKFKRKKLDYVEGEEDDDDDNKEDDNEDDDEGSQNSEDTENEDIQEEEKENNSVQQTNSNTITNTQYFQNLQNQQQQQQLQQQQLFQPVQDNSTLVRQFNDQPRQDTSVYPNSQNNYPNDNTNTQVQQFPQLNQQQQFPTGQITYQQQQQGGGLPPSPRLNISQQVTELYSSRDNIIQNASQDYKNKVKNKKYNSKYRIYDLKKFDFILTISQTREQDQNYDNERSFFLSRNQNNLNQMKIKRNPSNFLVNITRQENPDIQQNYLINSQDCSRNHAHIFCNVKYQFNLDNIQGRNGTFIKCQKYQKIVERMQLQVGNIFINFEQVTFNILDRSVKFKVKAFNLTSQDPPIETQETMQLNQVLTIGRNNSNFPQLATLFSRDSQLSRKHGEIHFKEVSKQTREGRILKNKFFFKEEGARNGSWVRIQDRKEIEHNTTLKIGLQNFLFIKIEANFKKLPKHSENKWREKVINKIQKSDEYLWHPGLIQKRDYSDCNNSYTIKHNHDARVLFISVACNHVYCQEAQKANIRGYDAEILHNNIFKKVCPICEEETTSYLVSVENIEE